MAGVSADLAKVARAQVVNAARTVIDLMSFLTVDMV